MALGHFHERVGESPRSYENYGTSGSKKSRFVSEIWPFKVGIAVRPNFTYRASQKKVGFRISNSPVVWDDQRLTKLTDTTQQLPPPPATKNLEFPKRNRTSNFGFWPAPKILYAVRMSLRRYPKFYIFTFWHFLAVFGQNKIGH